MTNAQSTNWLYNAKSYENILKNTVSFFLPLFLYYFVFFFVLFVLAVVALLFMVPFLRKSFWPSLV